MAADGTKLDLFSTPNGATSGYVLTTNGSTASWVEEVLMVLMGLMVPDGKTVLNGTAAPTSQGSVGDFFIDTTNNNLYGPRLLAGGVLQLA